jgi:hypothetical protein
MLTLLQVCLAKSANVKALFLCMCQEREAKQEAALRPKKQQTMDSFFERK